MQIQKLPEKRFDVAFRMPYMQLLQERSITKFIRPDKRIFPNHPKSYFIGQEVTAKVIEQPGSDILNIEPVFTYDFHIRLRITSVHAKALRELTSEDIQGLGPGCTCQQDVRIHLGIIYNKIYTFESIITLNEFEYI